MNIDDTTTKTTPTEPIAESALANQLAINRSQFSGWRKSGALKFPTHFFTRGRGEIMLTPEGQAEVARLLGVQGDKLNQPVKDAPHVAVKVIGSAVNTRMLRCKVVETQQRCSVKLVTPRVFASQFRPGTVILCAQDDSGSLSYEGKAPRKRRI